MNMFRHKHKSVQFEAALATISIERPSGRVGRDIRRRTVSGAAKSRTSQSTFPAGGVVVEASKQTSAAGSRVFTQAQPARAELPPFPEIFVPRAFCLGDGWDPPLRLYPANPAPSK